jgi:hypothetical protein
VPFVDQTDARSGCGLESGSDGRVGWQKGLIVRNLISVYRTSSDLSCKC